MNPSVARLPGMSQILLTFGLSICSLSILLPASPAWAIHGGAGSLGAGMTNAVLMIVTVLTQFMVPALTRRFSWAKVLPAGALFMGLPSLLQAVSPSLVNVLVSSGLRGVGFGIITVCCASALSYLIPLEYRGRAVGLYGLAAAGAQLIFTPLAPAALDLFGFRPVIMIGVIAALATPFAAQLGGQVDRYLTEQVTTSTGSSPAASTGEILRRIWPALLTLTLMTSVGGAFLTFSTEIAPTPVLASVALLALCAMATPTRLWGGSITDRWGTRRLMTPVLAFAAVGTVLVGLMQGAGVGSTVLLIGGALMIGFGYGFLQSVTMVRALNDAGGPAETQRASVAWNACFDVGTGLGALAIGALAQVATFSAAWLLSAAVLAFFALVVGVLDANGSRRVGESQFTH